MEEDRRVVAQISHEFRTPLNAILGYAQLLRADPTLSPEAVDKVVSILRNGERLLELLGELLSQSRPVVALTATVHSKAALPPLQPWPPLWAVSFQEAVAEGNVTKLRQLGRDADVFDPELARWIGERAARYELDDLRRLLESREAEVLQ